MWKKLTADQVEFVDMMIEHLTERGVMAPSLLYESPFTDLNMRGVRGAKRNARPNAMIWVQIGRPKVAGDQAAGMSLRCSGKFPVNVATT